MSVLLYEREAGLFGEKGHAAGASGLSRRAKNHLMAGMKKSPQQPPSPLLLVDVDTTAHSVRAKSSAFIYKNYKSLRPGVYVYYFPPCRAESPY